MSILECGVDVQGCGNQSAKLAFQRDIFLHLNGWWRSMIWMGNLPSLPLP